ncbi:MAG: bifunctional glutamate N-acetyltransferase/amino-acid acetyltransferase ArgJ [Peptococcaceae bacterium]|jgi:glutamate N-acetyltransferase/amino-acid N-acetyltransferase|nr:bifunctional glutamate N-acetyltransferase/amino-acid acetyltransferase ArgJ [Peptococcaceae bacterium]
MVKNIYPWQKVNGGVSAPLGFSASGVKAGIKNSTKYDLALIFSEVPANSAGVFTKNLVKAHPLLLTEKHLQKGTARAVIVNSGNANACVGQAGDEAAWQMAKVTAEELGISPEEVLVSSTGVIGQEMPMAKVLPGIKNVVVEVKKLKAEHNELVLAEHADRAAMAIMTTDTVPKELALELKCSTGTVKLGVMAKGSGMIHPNMGTMLCFLTTDAKVDSLKLKELLKEAVDRSFNMISVDGDTSTNDMVVILANGQAGVELQGTDWENFCKMVDFACCQMAMAIARDGEGASKFLEIKVTGAKTLEAARKIARSVCSSSLVKSAMYGQDANWGRILAAAGYAGADFDPAKVDIYLNGLQVAAEGQGLRFSEEEALKLLEKPDILIELRLKDGSQEATAWGCDLTHKYVDINANYRT